MKKQYIVLFFGLLLAPSFALASWWNPFTWFSKPVAPVTVSQELPVVVSPAPEPAKEPVKPEVKATVQPKVEVKTPVSVSAPQKDYDKEYLSDLRYLLAEVNTMQDSIVRSLSFMNGVFDTGESSLMKMRDLPQSSYSLAIISAMEKGQFTVTSYITKMSKYETDAGTLVELINEEVTSGEQYNTSKEEQLAQWRKIYANMNALVAIASQNFVTFVGQQASLIEGLDTQQTAPISPTALCEDMTLSYSQNRSGTCSHHGGVDTWY